MNNEHIFKQIEELSRERKMLKTARAESVSKKVSYIYGVGQCIQESKITERTK